MKKITAVFLCFVLFAAVFIPSAGAAGIRFIVSESTAPVLNAPSPLGSRIFELPRGEYVYVSETEGDFSHVSINSGDIDGWVYTPLLTYAGTTNYNPEKISSITILKKPDKLVYVEDEEEFDPAGMVITALKTDGTSIVLSGYKIYAPELSSCGKKTVYVTYKPAGSSMASFSASFEIEAVRVPLKKLSVVSYPSKNLSDYIEGQPLDLTGLKLKAEYSDGRADRIFTAEQISADGDFLITGCHSEAHGKKLTTGTHSLQILYKYPEISCELSVKVRQKKLVSFEMTSPPAVTTVYERKLPDLSGLTLKATYDNGEMINVDPNDTAKCRIICDPSKFILGKGNKLTVEYEGKSVTVDFTFALLEKTGLRLRLPQNLTFILGEPIDLSALEVYYVYSSGEVEKTTDFTRGDIDPMLTGAQTITVKSDVFSTSFTIYINPYYQRGDIDGNGKVEAADARLALRHAVGLIVLGGKTFSGGDADRSGKVDAADARLILRASVGLEDLLADIRNTKV